jgi:hypothetical protein
VIYDVTKLKIDLRVPHSLDEGIKRTANCFKTLGGSELRRNSHAFPSCAKRTVPADDEVIADFRYRNPARERRHCLLPAPRTFRPHFLSNAAIWHEYCESERQERESADERGNQMNCRGLDH